MSGLQYIGRTEGAGPDLVRHLNLWLGKFEKSRTQTAYADDLGLPHELRDWYAASDPATPGRRGRARGEFRRGVAFFPWCARRGLNPLTEVGLEQLQQWLQDTAEAGLAKSTRARMVTAVREFYTAMRRQGLPVGNPAALVDTRAAGLTGAATDDGQLDLTVAQVRQLLALARAGTEARRGPAYAARDLALLDVLAVTGARAAEVTGLDLADYRRAHPSAPGELVLHGKGGKLRTAQLDPHVADDLDQWLQHRAALLGHATPALAGQTGSGSQPLFCTRTGGRLATNYLGTVMRRLAAQDGSPLRGLADQLHPHALRAAFVTAALDAGVPIEEVAAAVGHEHISTTLQYDRRRRRRRSGAFRAVAGLVTDDQPDPSTAPFPEGSNPSGQGEAGHD